MTIQEIQNRQDLILVTDSQDARDLRQSLTKAEKKRAAFCDSFFVAVDEGYYEEIYGFVGIIPHLAKTLVKVR